MKNRVETISRSLLFLAVFLLLARLVLMAVIPVMGDEAYYFYWGMHPAGGYYDLPPMVGWWIAPFAKISLAPLWLRLPNLISILLICFGIYEWLSEFISKARALMIGGLFFVLPLPFFAPLMFPDIPLLFCSFFSAFLFYRGVAMRSKISYFFSGVLWGAAFLSKYFALLLVPAFGLWYLFDKKRKFSDLLFFVLGAIPFLFQHLLWNQQHCWANFVFNLISRHHGSEGGPLQTTGLFSLYLLVLSTPFLWGSIFKPLRFDLHKKIEESSILLLAHRYFLLLWLVPVLIFGITALLGKGQGLHWLIFVLPFFVMWVALKLTEFELERIVRKLAYLVGSISVLVSFVFLFPDYSVGKWVEGRYPVEYSLITHPDEWVDTLFSDVKSSAKVFTEGYTLSSILHYDFKRYAARTGEVMPEVGVWGSGSRFGRVFDWTSNFTQLEGQNLLIITPGELYPWVWSRYFKSIKQEVRRFRGHAIHLTKGTGFKSALYLKEEFKKPIETYYPKFLPEKCALWDLTHELPR